MKVVLESNGYVCVEAPTAEEGLRVFKEHNPDLVIVDLMMEEVDAGTLFVKELKVLGETVPVYLLSSAGDNLNLSVDYKELGLTGVFQKPLDSNMLLTILKQKLG